MEDKKLRHFGRGINNKKAINLRNLILTFIIVFIVIGFSLYGIFKSYEVILVTNVQKEMHEKLLITKGFLTLLDEQMNTGKLTKEEAQKTAKEYISGPIMENGYRDLSKSKLGFNDSVYTYAFSTSGIAIMHPFLEGKDLWNYRDEYGRYIIREIINDNRFGKILEYNWKDPGKNEFKALDYSEYFEPWGWIIGFVGNEQVIYLNKMTQLKTGMILFLLIIAPLITLIIQLLFVAKNKKEKLKKQFYYSSYFDSLTGLPNTILFNDRLRQKINSLKNKGQLLGVIVLDIDKFKKINDTMGHRVGDELLKEIAKRLKNCISDKHTLARHSADEFILLMSNINAIENSTDMAEEILEVLTKPFIIEGYELYITASMGISIYPYNGQTAEVLVKNADTAMNFVKGEGRNSYLLYAPSMDDTAIEQIELENDLRKALTKNELVLHTNHW
jgi:diguanylate cyclase (GGDEF)-like protein